MTNDDPSLSEFRGYFKAKEPGRRERAEAWATAIGLQDVDRLRVSSFLVKTAIRHINGEITQDQARKIIDAHYAGVSRHNEKSRSSGYEYFDPETGEKIESLDVYEAQRRLFEAVGCCDDSGVGKCSVKRVVRKSGKKSGKKTNEGCQKKVVRKGCQKTVDRLADLLKAQPHLTQVGMATALGISRQAIQKHIANLKAAGCLRRIGPDKGGHWEVKQ